MLSCWQSTTPKLSSRLFFGVGTSFFTVTFFISGLFSGVDFALAAGLAGELELNDGLLLPPLTEPLPAARADLPRNRRRDGAPAVAGDEDLAAVGVRELGPSPA